MPVTPPQVRPQFEPVFLTGDDLEDLTTFTGLSREACLERVRSYSLAEMAEAWRRVAPRAPEDIMRFYASTDLYIWELMQWHASPSRLPYWQALATLARRWPAQAGWGRVLDFGCGVGTDALYLAGQGYNVTLVDVPGPAFEFAKHRFRRRGLVARFVESNALLPEPDAVYDVAIAFDVLEHLPDPLQAARRLVDALRVGGILLQQVNFSDNGYHPCHLVEGARRFSGLRWRAHLAGLGLRCEGNSMIYARVSGLKWVIETCRFVLWRATRLWVVRT